MNGGPGIEPEQGPPRLALRMWLKFLAGGAIVFLLTGIATATAGLLEVKDVAEALTQRPPLRIDDLTPDEAGEPQTILLLGSDIRKADREAGRPGRSDTMMLVRMDPDREATSLMSVPRDLRVDIQLPNGNVQTDKINAAYSAGGPALTVKTIKDTLGIDINHVIDVDFKGFRAAVNFVGCVYIDVDRRYFNEDRAYAEIDIKPGYQRLCGQDALDYARYRHEDSDLVRAARQQEFVRLARNQVGVRRILEDRKEFARLFGRYARTDIRGVAQVLRLLKLVAFSADNPVHEVRFRADLAFEGGVSYVVASEEQIRRTVSEFLAARASPGVRPDLEQARAGRLQLARRGSGNREVAEGLEEAGTEGEDQAVAASGRLSFPIYYPRLRVRNSIYVENPRLYLIRDEEDGVHQAYRMVLHRGLVGEYYGVQAMSWMDPPILRNPDEERQVGGRELEIFYDGDRIALVAWRRPEAVYWISNTLLRSLSNEQMIAIAHSLQRVGQ